MKWDIWDSLEYNPQTAEALTPVTGSALTAAVLAARGVDTPEKAAKWLATDTDRLHSPFLLAGIPDGVARIRRAIESGETVAVYGDYDVDGITASALLADYLRGRGLTCNVYIPDRLEEGYGLNTGAIQSLAGEGVTLVITVDCGITAVEETEFARGLGVDMVITDHHECQADLPAAVAVIDPKRPDCLYPDKELAGVGVAFKLICAVDGPEHTEDLIARYGDLVAVGTVADVMNLTGENRIFVARGLEAIRTGSRVGLTGLIREAGLEQEKVTVTNIGYGIAPRINAAGRMGSTDLAFALLGTDDPVEADRLAGELCALNRRRQEVEQTILAEAGARLEEIGYTDGPIILASENWHKGVVGIVASRLAERYREPVIMLSIEGDEAKGSCRSARGFNLFAALTACGEHLETFGGHELAAGLTVKTDALERFTAAFGAYYRENPTGGEGDALEVDFTLGAPELITLEEVRGLDRLEPCGRGNPSPVLVLEGATLTRVQPIGGGKHLKLQVEKWHRTYDCVFFSATADRLGAREGDRVDLAFTPQVNEFRGRTTVQLLIRDVCPTGRRLTGTARRVYGRLVEGQPITSREAETLCPGRDDFVRLWKGLRRREEQVQGPIADVLDALVEHTRGGDTAKYYVCLKVMDELGLASVREQADNVDIQLNGKSEKVDLDSSRVLTALRRAMG